eukprot:gene21414-25730_t
MENVEHLDQDARMMAIVTETLFASMVHARLYPSPMTNVLYSLQSMTVVIDYASQFQPPP